MLISQPSEDTTEADFQVALAHCAISWMGPPPLFIVISCGGILGRGLLKLPKAGDVCEYGKISFLVV